MYRLALLLVFLFALPALAVDRHVYLNSSGGGTQLNDCPNPSHSADGTSNKAELFYCANALLDNALNRIICDAPSGCKSWTTTTGQCTSIANQGTVTAVTNNVSVVLDTGTRKVYGHPQACVWNMAKSDSCEVHAGTYRTSGAQCHAGCGNTSNGTTCYDWNCYLASVVAFGYGPNLDGTGYGTLANPGYLRGAVMNGVTDTWDVNGDKNPADGTYSAILSGDRENIGVADLTSCNGSTCSGDSFAGVWVGCGGASGTGYDRYGCSSTASQRVQVDTDANGTFDSDANTGGGGGRSVHHLVIKDLALTGYNQGNGSTDNSGRNREAIINLNGDGDSDGLTVDHVYLYGNAFSASPAQELFWAAIADMKNRGCSAYVTVKNSFIHQNNKFVFNDEGSSAPSSGCSWLIHDNRIYVDVQGTRPTTAIGYWKNLDYHPEDSRPKVVRFFNNEVIYKQTDTVNNAGWFADLQHFGNSGGLGKGEFWVYGNLFRNDPNNTRKVDLFLPSFCSEETTQTGDWRFYYFNNTWDGWSSARSVNLNRVCGTSANYTGELYVGRNNVEVWTTNEQYTTNANTLTISNNVSTDANRCTGTTSRYFACGSDPATEGGLAYYTPYGGGGLIGMGSCDPDGNGVTGVDYDGNGSEDTIWTDIAGNTVNCGTSIHIGAIQATSGGPTQTCGNNMREGTEVCDGTDFGTNSCVGSGFAGGSLTCNSCTSITTENCTLAAVGRSLLQGVTLKGGSIK